MTEQNPLLTNVTTKAPPQESVANFISQIEDRHLAQYPSYQKAQTAKQALPDKEYVYRYFMKRAKYEFVVDLMKKLRSNPKMSTEWGKEKYTLLQRVMEAIRLSMHSESAFANEEQKRRALKQEEEERERKRLNTWV